jgi:hypothetical protein
MPDDTRTDGRTVQQPYRVGDPVVDLAQGRPMVVLEAPAQSVAAWSEANDYSLTGNYANGKLDARDDEAVVRCVYVSDIRSEPSKDYTFPASRIALIDAHHADGGERIADRVVRDVLEALFTLARTLDEDWSVEPDGFDDALGTLVANCSAVNDDVATQAIELADIAHTISQEEGGDD